MIDLLPFRKLWVENGLGIVEDDEHFLGRQGMSKRDQFLGVIDSGTDNLRKSTKEVGLRRLELVAADEPPVVAKPLLNAIVVEDSQCDRCFANPTRTNKGDRIETFGEANDVFDEVIASETIPRWRGRRFSDRKSVV